MTEVVMVVVTAPKSNRAYLGINAALNNMDCGDIGRVPIPLHSQHFPRTREARKIEGSYRCPHGDPRGVLSRQYLSNKSRDGIYCQPSSHGYEAAIGGQLARLRLIQKMRQNVRITTFGIYQALGNNRGRDPASGVLIGVLTSPVERWSFLGGSTEVRT